MKTEISRDSHQPDKRYTGVYQQQGRMLTDSDWNELVEILKDRLKESLKDIVGNSYGSIGATPRHRALRVIADVSESFRILPGQIYVDGDAATLPGDTDIAYDEQIDFPNPPEKPDSGTNYYVYADIWERAVTQLYDGRIRDKALHGADTCTRKQAMVQLKWCDDSLDPEVYADIPAKGNAELNLTLASKTTEPDTCDPCVSELDIDSRVGNYLFRVEIHDVKGPANSPTEITIKWSSENGAEQYIATEEKAQLPAGFISDKWNYEFYNEICEKHLGVHFGNGTWEPARGQLEHIKSPGNTYSNAKPDFPDNPDTTDDDITYVRRWDGYCTLDLSSDTVVGYDKDVSLSLGNGDDLGDVTINTSVTINLSSIKLELALNGHQFVAGDYWLVDVREAEHDPLDEVSNKLLINEQPLGIDHYYLKLGHVINEVLQDNPETDRKLSFPSLSEMTRIFSAGGDGQEVIPGQALPQDLRIGVANGEWPVEGAAVRFVIEAGNGSLNPADGLVVTDENGIAECEWTTGDILADEYRVKASLVNPDDPSNALMDYKPPIYFYADIVNADQVAYQPVCGINTVNTIHDYLNDESILIPGDDNYYTVKEVLDALLCHLKAKHIPYDPTQKPLRWEDINEESDGEPAKPLTIQDALDNIVDNLESSDIRYGFEDTCTETNYGVPSLNSYIREDMGKTDLNSATKVENLWDTLLCLLDAKRIPYDPTNKDARWRDIKELGNLSSLWTVEEQTPGSIKNNLIVEDNDENLISAAASNVLSGDGKYYSVLQKLDPDGEIIWKKELNLLITGLALLQDGSLVLGASVNEAVDLQGEIGNFEPGSDNDLVLLFVDTDGGFNKFINMTVEGGDADHNTCGISSIAVDSADSIYMTGFFSKSINTGYDEMLVPNSDQDIFLIKFTSEGDFEWFDTFSTDGEANITRVAINNEDETIITGTFKGELTFDGDYIFTSTSPTTNSMFIAKYNQSGDYIWADRFGGNADCSGFDILVNENHLLVTGNYNNVINFGNGNLPIVTNDTAFVVQFEDTGNSLNEQWHRSFPSTAQSFGFSLVLDNNDNYLMAGSFTGDIVLGSDEHNTTTGADVYLAQLDDNGNVLRSAIFGIGHLFQFPYDIIIDSDDLPVIAWQLLQFPANSTLNKISKFSWDGDLSPATVQQAIDDLIENIDSSDINYKLPQCAGENTLRYRLGNISHLPDNLSIKIKTLIDIFLCELDATSIPFDKDTNSGSLVDGFVNKSGDTINGNLAITSNLSVGNAASINGTLTANTANVNGTVTANAFVGDGSGLTGVISSKWEDGSNNSIYYDSGNVGINNPNPAFTFHHLGGDFVIEDTDISLRRDGTHRWRLRERNTTGFQIYQVYNDANVIQNTSRFEIEDNGNVKIGTSGSSYPFHVAQSTSSWQSRFVNGNANVYLNHASGYGIHINTGQTNSSSRYGLQVRNSTQTHLYVREDGRTGLGTTAPADQLHLLSSASNRVYIQSTGTSTHAGVRASTPNRQYFFGINTGSSRWCVYDNNAQLERFSILSNGNVGIGTTAPGADKLDVRGRCYSSGGWRTSNADYAEYFESKTKKRLSRGVSVILGEDGYIKAAKKGEIPIGIISSNSSIVGNSYKEWPNKFQRDEFGTVIMEEIKEEIKISKKEKLKTQREKVELKQIKEEVTSTKVVFENTKYLQKTITETVTREVEESVYEEVNLYDETGKEIIGKHKIPVMEDYEEEIEVLDDDGNPVMVGSGEFTIEMKPKLNPDYDETKEYIPREDRPEWNCVGLLGQLALKKGQPVASGWIKIKDISDEVELWLVK